ncbi:MAG: biotin transporter BioY [Ruminococcaceae bacterium]|nr:biotin transporter BioY [Oscillospiraceae bacterium]
MSDANNKTSFSKTKIKNIALISLFSAIIAVCAFISVPFAVPFTMQLFGIFCALYLLGGKNATLAILLYVFLGAVGLPVFSGFTGGIGRLLDATGGFIWGFLLSGISFWAVTHFLKNKKHSKIIALFVALFVCYISGGLWFAFFSEAPFFESLKTALLTCIVPFIIPDILKILLTVLLCRKVEKHKFF